MAVDGASRLAELFERMADPVWQAEHAIRYAAQQAARTDPWRWYCRLCGAKGSVDAEQARDHDTFAHVDACPCGRFTNVGTESVGRLRHVWSYPE